MRSLKQLSAMLQDMNIRAVSRELGLNWRTVNKIKDMNGNPYIKTVEALNEYFDKKEGRQNE